MQPGALNQWLAKALKSHQGLARKIFLSEKSQFCFVFTPIYIPCLLYVCCIIYLLFIYLFLFTYFGRSIGQEKKFSTPSSTRSGLCVLYGQFFFLLLSITFPSHPHRIDLTQLHNPLPWILTAIPTMAAGLVR